MTYAREFRAHIVWADGGHTYRDATTEKDARELLRRERDEIKRGSEPVKYAAVETRRVMQWETLPTYAEIAEVMGDDLERERAEKAEPHVDNEGYEIHDA